MSEDFTLPRAHGTAWGKRRLLIRAIDTGSQDDIRAAALIWATAAREFLRHVVDGRDPGTLAADIAFEVSATAGLVDELTGAGGPVVVDELSELHTELRSVKELVPAAQQPPRERLN